MASPPVGVLSSEHPPLDAMDIMEGFADYEFDEREEPEIFDVLAGLPEGRKLSAEELNVLLGFPPAVGSSSLVVCSAFSITLGVLMYRLLKLWNDISFFFFF
jgi:hypothetical protein